MNERQHALLARELIQLCGGLDESTANCRLSRSHLHRCTQPGSGCYLPMDAVDDLQTYCGKTPYTDAVSAAQPSRAEVESLREEACEVVEGASDLERTIRLATKNGVPTPAVRVAIDGELNTLEEKIQ